ncbi:MAG: thermonuclease family protein [Halofilum sp. (in: g-proteobacteria)]
MGACLFPASASSAPAECAAERIDEQAVVDSVTDGDTVRLSDGRQVRIIGLNTPELGRDGAPDEPFAQAARQSLQRLIASADGRVGLQIGREARDNYDRLLAHLYLPDGRNITERLLERGYGLRVVVPPNLAHQRCYARAEAAARAADRGVWTEPRFLGVPADRLPADAGGFAVVTGRIIRVGESRSAFWLELDGKLTLRLPKNDLPYFDGEPQRREGQRLRVRGWIYRVDDEPRMNLRHPAAVEWLSG